MSLGSLRNRVRNRLRADASRFLFQRRFEVAPPVPLVSFTFDDFPRSAFREGGAILRDHGLSGTYYASLGLMGQTSVLGPLFLRRDLEDLLAQGHELGSHTYAHLDPWETRPEIFEESIAENDRALEALIPGAAFRTFSYPLQFPRPGTKRRVSGRFPCSRGGGRDRTNSGWIDLNLLEACFLTRAREDLAPIRDLIDRNRRARGWLIFATHDIGDRPSPHGCTPAFFESVVRLAVASGARVLPVVRAWEAVASAGSRAVPGPRVPTP